MCNYCGCREFPLIARLTEEHAAIEEAVGQLRRAIYAERSAESLRLLDALIGLLAPHTATEETGILAELRADGTLADGVRELSAEHEEISRALGTVDRSAPDWGAVLATLDRLCRHIDNEEYGLFPAAAIALPITAWDRITPAESR